MSKRPILKLRLTNIDRLLELFGWLSLTAVWFLTLINYGELPDIIPIHYDETGEADSFGDKKHLLTIPIIVSILFIGMTILNKFPHVFNFPVTITEENAYHQYKSATRMIRLLKLVIVVVFGLIVLKTLQSINGKTEGLGAWFLPLFLVLIFIPLIYYFINLKKGNTGSR